MNSSTKIPAVLTMLMASMVLAVAQTTFNETDKHAWGTNTGWISFQHDQDGTPQGIVFGESFLSGLAYSANTGWINFGDGSPSNGHTYSNIKSDHGVNHDGAGNLSGYAWAANTGWINFGWTITSDANRPRVNLLTGAFSGYAWSSNTGWINLGTGILTTRTMHCSDVDTDNIADHWEWLNFGDLTSADADTDQDGDGVLDKDEYTAGTDPNDATSYLKIISHIYNEGYTEITLKFTTTPARLYRIEYSTDLGKSDAWTDSSLGMFIPDAGVITTKNVTFATSHKMRCFFRAVALRPLTP